MRAAVLCTALLQLLQLRSVAAGSARRVGWWWDAPPTAADPKVDAMLDFAANHSAIVSSVIMQCGPTTKNGVVAGSLLPSCVRAIPALAKLGIGAELWLGETDANASALKLFETASASVSFLVSLAKANPGLTGFNFDLEVGGSSWCPKGKSCSGSYAAFLKEVKAGLIAAGHTGIRVTVDAQCSTTGKGVTQDCKTLASGADVFMNMDTYNSDSYEHWLDAFKPAVAPGVPRAQLGAGLGCWYQQPGEGASDGRRQLQPVPAWSVTEESAEQRICAFMNHSVVEIDMFLLAPAHFPVFPEDFWIAPLERFVKGGGCPM